MKTIQEERNKIYARAITRIRQAADDKNLRKEQRLQVIRQTMKELDEQLWLLEVKEAQEEWRTANAF